MEDFIMRTITEASDGYDMSVTRTRNTNGYAGISVVVGSQKINFENTKLESGYGDNYADAVIELARILSRVAENNCELPK